MEAEIAGPASIFIGSGNHVEPEIWRLKVGGFKKGFTMNEINDWNESCFISADAPTQLIENKWLYLRSSRFGNGRDSSARGRSGH